VVVGSGAAGFNAADRLHQYGQTDIALVTEGINVGTSRNTGSDKQTYYKLTLSGDEPDSVAEMAQTLFSGQCVDGDIALCEAALSTQCFLKLVELGVPFPRNRYGEYIGYKTDHDPRCRATSVGPYTSRAMTEALENSVRARHIDIFDQMQLVRILSDGTQVLGVLCLDLAHADDPAQRFVAFRCKNIVLATGGPAGMYANSVYPAGHCGATGTAFRIGAAGRNLTEWQYGLASVKPRWNVSGTYMQALPRFISTAADGTDEREFLYDFFSDEGELLSQVFLKGYQWPFDVRKVANGSSIIDILVYLESMRNRRIWLDFSQNPGGGALCFDQLSQEARTYLECAGACFGTPFQRLQHMNAPAVDFYRERGVDLATQPLEIALCAQHNNGGVATDCWWQTNVCGLFCVGEAAATHGVYRPGGSALNAGQVGSTRAAQYIAAQCRGETDTVRFTQALAPALDEVRALCDAALSEGEDTLHNAWHRAGNRMSSVGAAIRNRDALRAALSEVEQERKTFSQSIRITTPNKLSALFRLEDILLCQQTYLGAMVDYIDHGGRSRGSALYTDPNGQKPFADLPDTFTFALDNSETPPDLQEVRWENGALRFSWRRPRPIPQQDNFFENVWRTYRENQNIF
jgi:succinate dehydrogenase/fumarate reductase flavoprotein subunit